VATLKESKAEAGSKTEKNDVELEFHRDGLVVCKTID